MRAALVFYEITKKRIRKGKNYVCKANAQNRNLHNLSQKQLWEVEKSSVKSVITTSTL